MTVLSTSRQSLQGLSGAQALREAGPLRGLAFDARYAKAEPSGIGQLCLELLRGLADAPELDHLKVLVDDRTCLPADVAERPNLTLCRAPWPPMSPVNQLYLPGLLRHEGIRVLHSIDSFQPLLASGVRRIIHIHDLIPIACGGALVSGKKARFHPLWRAWLRLQCAWASRVVTGSRYSAADIVRRLGVAPDKIRVIPNPIRDWSHIEEPELFRRRFGLPGRVISYVGRQEPYKNVLSLVRAMKRVSQQWGERSVQLVVAGSQPSSFGEMRQEVRRLGLEAQVLFTGYLSEADLGALYRVSDVFVFPSLYEGFGMPPLEAMRFGTPVITSRRTAIPEILGDAALYVDTEDPAAIADGILQLLCSPALARDYRQRGRRQARRYARRQIAAAYVLLYREVAAGRRPVQCLEGRFKAEARR
jgi:glycosyltransferase involved in cell wall biosynthesis